MRLIALHRSYYIICRCYSCVVISVYARWNEIRPGSLGSEDIAPGEYKFPETRLVAVVRGDVSRVYSPSKEDRWNSCLFTWPRLPKCSSMFLFCVDRAFLLFVSRSSLLHYKINDLIIEAKMLQKESCQFVYKWMFHLGFGCLGCGL